jgi:hypothetical protein
VDDPRIRDVGGRDLFISGGRRHPNIRQGWATWHELAVEGGWLEAARVLSRIVRCHLLGHQWKNASEGEQWKDWTVHRRECRRCERYEYQRAD